MTPGSDGRNASIRIVQRLKIAPIPDRLWPEIKLYDRPSWCVGES
jgi:hypothetical protein